MTRQLWHFIDAATGVGTGHSVFDFEERVRENIPDGQAIWAADEFDHLCERVDLEAAAVVPYQPPAPADTDLVTWRWDATARRWVGDPTLLAMQQQARVPILLQLKQLDEKLARPVGEIAEAQALGETLPTAAVTRLQAINADKQLLRDQLAAIAAATDENELHAVPSPTLQTIDS